MRFFKLAALLTVLGSCGEPPRWMQFHADGQGRGFVGAHSSAATSAIWLVDVGPVGFSSPSLQLDGTIYVGNHNGELVAVNPDGTIKWRFQAPFSDQPFIESSPAVSSAGLIYFIVDHGVGGNNGTSLGESVLFSLDNLKNVRCSFILPQGAVTTSSPRTWTSGSNINVIVATGWGPGPGAGLLEVFDQECHVLSIANRDCPHDVVGGGLDWNLLLAIFAAGLSALFSPFQFQVQGVTIPLLDPTPAIVDFPREAGKAIIVAGTTGCGLHAFTWDPSARTLTRQWAQPNARGNSISSPAVSQQGQVVIGQDDGHVLAFDLVTGKPLWDFDATEPVMATPAFFVGATQVYVASKAHVHKIDTDGTLVQTIGFPATLSSAAMTWDRVYIGSDGGLFTLQFDLSIDGVGGGARGGGSSPTVAPDGTVYSVDVDHILRAYRR